MKIYLVFQMKNKLQIKMYKIYHKNNEYNFLNNYLKK